MKKISLSFILIFSLAGCGAQVADNQAVDAEDNVLSPVVLPSDNQKKEIEENRDIDSKDNTKEELKAIISDDISLTSVKDDDLLVSPALIAGEANIESGIVMIELRKSDHSLTSESVEAVVRDGEFKIEKFWFEFNNTSEGFVAVYDRSNKENIVEIPVRFQTVK